VRAEDDRIVLVPMRPGRAEGVRAKLENLGIREQDVDETIEWGRRK